MGKLARRHMVEGVIWLRLVDTRDALSRDAYAHCQIPGAARATLPRLNFIR